MIFKENIQYTPHAYTPYIQQSCLITFCSIFVIFTLYLQVYLLLDQIVIFTLYLQVYLFSESKASYIDSREYDLHFSDCFVVLCYFYAKISHSNNL